MDGGIRLNWVAAPGPGKELEKAEVGRRREGG